MLVLRPEDPARFNGTVLVNWNNVSAGYENLGGGDSPEVLEGGYAFVAVSAQRAGVHGLPENPQGLVAWDPERYGSLSVTSDDFSYDIVSQAARSVAPGLRGTTRLGVLIPWADSRCGGWSRRRVAVGRPAGHVPERRAAARRPVRWLLPPHVLRGRDPARGGRALMTVPAASDGSGPPIPEGLNVLRDDLGVRIMVVNTECEATSCYGVRQADTDHYRYWEIAGASHVTLAASPRRLRPRLRPRPPNRAARDRGAGVGCMSHADDPYEASRPR